jgi:hypothetical protein
MTRLFVGGCVQNALVAAGIRVLSVEPSVPLIMLTTGAVQALWWLNIQQVKKSDSVPDGVAWVAGNVAGAVIGFLLTGGSL